MAISKNLNSKSNNHSIPEEKATKTRARNSNWEENVAKALEEWAMQDDRYMIEEFYTARRIPKSTWDDAVKRNKVLHDANTFAKERCGINRELLAIKRGESINSTNSFILPNYFTRWEQQLEYRNELKVKAAAQVATPLTDFIIKDYILANKKETE